PNPSRRSFLVSSGGMVTGAWMALHWPGIAAAAHHAEAAAPVASAELKFLTAAEAPQVEAVAAQIIPSGATPGAREAHVVHFIDYALLNVFPDQAPTFRTLLAQFQ